MSLSTKIEEVKCQMERAQNLEDAKEALMSLKTFGIEASLSNINMERSIAENDDGAMNLNDAIQEVVRDLKLYVDEDACLICGGDVEDIKPFFDEEKKATFLYFHTKDSANFAQGFRNAMKKVEPDVLNDVSRVLLMFLGDFDLMQVNNYGKKVLSVLPIYADMAIGLFCESGDSEMEQEACEEDFADKMYAEVLCLMI